MPNILTREPYALPPFGVTVTTSPTVVVAANEARRGLCITNISDTESIFLALGSNVPQLNKGIALLPHGSLCFDDWANTVEAISAIATGSAVLSGQEWQE